MEKFEVAIVGGGAAGLAICRKFHELGKSCLLLEKNFRCGMETSSRNSEVIHSGIYYPPGSLKQKFCIEGKDILLEYLKRNNVYYNLCGKLILAQDDDTQKTKLLKLFQNGQANGLTELRLLRTKSEVLQFQKDIDCHSAIFSPYTGIFDTEGFLNQLQVDITVPNFNGLTSTVLTNCEFLSADQTLILSRPHFRIKTSRGEIAAEKLINAAGLNSHVVANHIQDMPRHKIPTLFFAKGNYFKLGRDVKPFNMLVYPLPKEGGLGVHATIDPTGSVRFGPNVEWLKNISSSRNSGTNGYGFSPEIPLTFSYAVSDSWKRAFYNEIAEYFPSILDYDLVPDYSGIRTKLSGPFSNNYSDFLVQTSEQHGVNNLINLFGIESPGMTSCMSIAEYISRVPS
jgi:2-hydroxyglutarate dehydrogenase